MSYQNCFQYNFPYGKYETYELESCPQYQTINCLQYQNPCDNYQSNPYSTNISNQNYSPNPIEPLSSLSNSDQFNNSNKKFYDSNSFESELRKQYNDLNKNKCNCDCHKKINCNCNCNPKINSNVNVNELLNELSEIKSLYKQLNNDFNKAKNEKNFADNYIKNLEIENNKFKDKNLSNQNQNNINEEIVKLKKDKGRYVEMLDQAFMKILIPD